MKIASFKNLDRMDMLALALCLFAFSFWAILLTYKFYHFGYYDWDLAFFAQGMWNLCHGSGHVSLFDTNLFSNHANLIAYLILPIYILFTHPLTLVFLKLISYITAAFVLYVLAKEKLESRGAILFLWLYLIFSPNVFGIVYEFDFESLAPAFLMLIFYFYEKERWLGFLICAAILVLIKENMPLIILAFSIHGLFTKKDKIRFALIPGILGLVSFYLLVYVFIPYMSGRPIGEEQHYYIENNYKNLGGSVGSVLFSVIFHPIKTCHYLLTPVNLSFVFYTFNPFLYLPLAAPGILFLISPILLQHFLSSSATEHYVGYAYVLTIAPFLFLATIKTLRIFYKMRKKVYYVSLILLFSLNTTILVANFWALKDRFMLKDSLQQTKKEVHEQWELVRMVPQDASVIASFPFLAPLSQRKDLYAFYKMYDSRFQNSQWSYQLPIHVQYALIDIRDSWLLLEPDYNLAKARAQKFLTSGDWVIIKRYGRYILYKRTTI